MVKLPKYLTPMQAVAWVSLRDPAMVELAGDLKTPSPGHVAEVMLPSGLAVETLPGRPGLSRLKIGAYWATKQDEGELLLLPPDDAERELLAELREGRITAHGRAAPGVRAERIPSIEWEAMGFSDGGDGRANALFACTLYPDGSPTGLRAAWQDVRLDGADLMRRWPPIPSREERAAAWAIREAEIALAVKASEDGRDARPGFMWAGDALRHIAWGEVVYPHPAGMSPVEAFAKLKAASQRLCDALAVGEIQATGRRGDLASGRYATSERAKIPREFFEPGIVINLASWAAPDDGGCMADYALRREEEAPDWGRVMLDAAEVEMWCVERGEAPLGAQYRTGAPGRPSSAQLVEAEFRRRRDANETCRSLSGEAQYLEEWLGSPATPQGSPRAPDTRR
jgi:hypothetical protein